MKKNYPKGLLLYGFLCIIMSLKSYANTVDTLLMKPGIYEQDLRKFYRYYNDKNNGGIINAIKELNVGNFLKNTHDVVLNQPSTPTPYWIALYIKNDTSISFPITWNFYEDGITFTLFDITNPQQPQKLDSFSTTTPTDKRGLAVRSVSFKVMLPAGETIKLLAKCSITTANQMYIPTDVTTPDDILLYEMDYSFLVGKFFGFFLFALLFNLLVWCFTRTRLHLYQFLYILSISSFNVIELLYDAMLFPKWIHHLFVLIPKSTFLALSIFFAINVFEQFTELKATYPAMYRNIQWLKIFVLFLVCLFTVPLCILPNNHHIVLTIRNYTTLLTLCSYLIFIAFILIGCIKKNLLHLFYLVSASPILLGFISFVLNGYFRFKIYHIEPGNMMVGLAIELLLQTLFFSYRYYFLNRKIYTLEEDKFEIERTASQSVMLAQEMERTKISEDLHDQLGNDFIGLKLLSEKLIRINKAKGFPIDENLFAEMKTTINEMASNIRFIAHALAQIQIEEKGIFALIKSRIELLNNNCQTHFTFQHEGNPETLSNISKITIYRIIIESINNIVKHAEATNATLILSINDVAIGIVAKDNGKGFNVDNLIKGIGLYTIKARTEAMKGKITINSALGKGCTISISIPTEFHKNFQS